MDPFFHSFQELLDHMAESCPDRIALRFSPDEKESHLTYRELRDEVVRRKERILDEATAGDFPPAIRMEAGRTVLLTGKTDLNWILNLLASVTAGCMTVLSDPSRPRHQVQKEWDRKGQSMLPCQKEDRLLSVLPLNHVFGFVCAFLWPLTQGAEIDLGTGLRGLLTDCGKYKPTILTCVPTLLGLFLKADVLNPELRMVLVGAGPCDPDLVSAVLKKGIHLRFGYGLTETSSGVAISIEDSDPYGFVPCPDTSFRITEEGELLLRTPCMMQGYYDLPDKTEEKLIQGELHTGDLASLDEKGRIHILGRIKDVLVLPNGEKIFCPEVEAALQKVLLGSVELALLLDHKKLALAVRRKKEDQGKAFHGLTPEEAVDQWNAGESLGRRIQKILYLEEEFPRTATGKLKRYLLQEMVENRKSAGRN